VKPGELLSGAVAQPAFKVFWGAARSDTFALPESMLAVRSLKTR
jgi:hypothetical protein